MSYHSRLTSEDKIEMMKLYKEGLKPRDIASYLEYSQSQVEKSIYRTNLNATLPPKPIMKHRMADYVLGKAIRGEADLHPKFGRDRLRKALQYDHPKFKTLPSSSTIRRYLLDKNHDHNYASIAPLLRPQNVHARWF